MLDFDRFLFDLVRFQPRQGALKERCGVRMKCVKKYFFFCQSTDYCGMEPMVVRMVVVRMVNMPSTVAIVIQASRPKPKSMNESISFL